MPRVVDEPAALSDEPPRARTQLDWSVDTLTQGVAQLGMMLTAAGVEDVGAILDAIEGDVERLVGAHGNPTLQKAAASMVAVALNRALRNAKAPCVLEPIEGETAWRVRRTEVEEIEWPPWMVPQLLLALLGPATIVGISWLLFARSAYVWLFAYLALTVGSVVASTKASERPSLAFRIAISVVAVGTSVVAVVGLHVSGEAGWAMAFAGILTALHLAMFGLDAWKRASDTGSPSGTST